MTRTKGFTFVEAVVTMAAVGMAMSLVFAGISKNRLNELQLESVTQQRGIIQSIVTSSNDNNDYYPGLNAKGEVIDVSTAGVFQVLLDRNSFDGRYAIGPMEDLEPWQPGQKVTTDQLSYAILDIHGLSKEDGRRREWRTTINSQAAVLSDRNTQAEEGYASVWTPYSDQEGWLGGVAWNDGRATYEMQPELSTTKYGSGDPNKKDHLFEADDADDALMTFLKDEEGKEKVVPARPVPEDVAGEEE